VSLAGESLPDHQPKKKKKKVVSATQKHDKASKRDVPHPALLVLDAPRIRRPGSDDLLSVVHFASGGEVLTASQRLDVEDPPVDPPVADFLKDPLSAACQRSRCKP